jgi:chaperone modulatory protein CbpM
MIALEALVGQFSGFERIELLRWVENRWVLPARRGGSWVFDEVDIAPVELILEIRREWALDDEAMPLLLGLLDQVYEMRRQLRRLCEAVAAQPAEIREAIERTLARRGR